MPSTWTFETGGLGRLTVTTNRFTTGPLPHASIRVAVYVRIYVYAIYVYAYSIYVYAYTYVRVHYNGARNLVHYRMPPATLSGRTKRRISTKFTLTLGRFRPVVEVKMAPKTGRFSLSARFGGMFRVWCQP